MWMARHQVGQYVGTIRAVRQLLEPPRPLVQHGREPGANLARRGVGRELPRVRPAQAAVAVQPAPRFRIAAQPVLQPRQLVEDRLLGPCAHRAAGQVRPQCRLVGPVRRLGHGGPELRPDSVQSRTDGRRGRLGGDDLLQAPAHAVQEGLPLAPRQEAEHVRFQHRQSARVRSVGGPAGVRARRKASASRADTGYTGSSSGNPSGPSRARSAAT